MHINLIDICEQEERGPGDAAAPGGDGGTRSVSQAAARSARSARSGRQVRTDATRPR